MKHDLSIVSIAYFPPIQFFTRFFDAEELRIEKHEHLQRQSYQNRCHIATAAGLQALVVPILHSKEIKTSIHSARISYQSDWQKNHLKAIESAYNNSPFYEYYSNELIKFFTTKEENLFLHNTEIIKTICTFLNLQNKISFTSEYSNIEPDKDFRSKIHPKQKKTMKDASFIPCPYAQVFQDRVGFLPNLSILDLLFNQGPESHRILKESIRK